MKLFQERKSVLIAVIVSAVAVAGCTTDQAIDNTAGVASGTVKVVAKGAVGAGKLAYKGGKKIVGANGE
jgi:outer membrane murein-binding lipoprotein Lpp